MARLGRKVLAADLDPQANLTSAFFDEDRLEKFWEDDGGSTVLGGVLPILRGLGDIRIPEVLEVAEGLWVLPGDLGLSRFEDKLSEAWPHGYDGDEAALRVTTSFHRMLRGITDAVGAQVVIVDVGPNLGAINRAALLGADDLLVPLAADLFSLQGLRNLGPTSRSWRHSWQQNVLPRAPEGLDVPSGAMRPIGYAQSGMSYSNMRFGSTAPSRHTSAGFAESPPSFTSQCSAKGGLHQKPATIRTVWPVSATIAA
jgi:chromosome partitioning protein